MKKRAVLCREPGCGQEIIFGFNVKTKNHIPLNPRPDPAGNMACYTDGTGTFRARVPTAEDRIDGFERLYMPHAATCAARKKPATEPPAEQTGNVIPLFGSKGA